jgi:hypothetical protein
MYMTVPSMQQLLPYSSSSISRTTGYSDIVEIAAAMTKEKQQPQVLENPENESIVLETREN